MLKSQCGDSDAAPITEWWTDILGRVDIYIYGVYTRSTQGIRQIRCKGSTAHEPETRLDSVRLPAGFL